MSPRQSDQIFQRSRVSRIGPWSCSLNVFSLSFLWSGHVSFIILVSDLNSPWPLLELLHSVIQYRALGQIVLGSYRHHFYGQGPGKEITFKLIHSTQCTMGWLRSLMTPYKKFIRIWYGVIHYDSVFAPQKIFDFEYFSGMNIFQGWILFRGEYFSGVNIFQG